MAALMASNIDLLEISLALGSDGRKVDDEQKS